MEKGKKAAKKGSAMKSEEVNVKRRGKFNFPNGDTYEGEYIVIDKREIYRHGNGVYKTSDQDEYRATWNKDCIMSDLHIVYANKAEYYGDTDAGGEMIGNGTYIFPDGTALNATWKNNEPHSQFLYMDLLGFHWIGELSANKEIIFSPENWI